MQLARGKRLNGLSIEKTGLPCQSPQAQVACRFRRGRGLPISAWEARRARASAEASRFRGLLFQLGNSFMRSLLRRDAATHARGGRASRNRYSYRKASIGSKDA